MPRALRRNAHPELSWLDNMHPMYFANRDRWLLNERRLMGGDDVLPELQPFDWETLRGPGSNYYSRQLQATYPNFADDFMTLVTGHLLKFSPKPDAGLSFGSLGEVRRGRTTAQPTRAEQLYYSADSPGSTGTPWDPWWMDVMRMAGATGHRWVFVEAPDEAPFSVQDESQGKRPYLVHISPVDVPNWHFGLDGRLDFAVIRFINDSRFLQTDGLQVMIGQNPGLQDYLLVVREGYNGLGPQFQAGGWFKFNWEKDDYDSGNFDDTAGEIPCFPVFYQRSRGTPQRPAISRPGTSELGAAGVAYMNLLSAANFDAWDAAKSLEWLQGVDDEGYALAKTKLDAGSRWIPLQPNQDTEQTPTVNHGAAGAVQHEVFTSRLLGIERVVEKLGVAEATGSVVGSPNTNTGASKNASFSTSQVPRIVHVATNLGTAQNTALYFLERRWGSSNPSGQANWPLQLDLVELVEKLRSFFEVERIAGIRSKSIDAKAMVMVAEQKGIIATDDEKAQAEAEYLASAELRDKLEALSATMVDDTLQNTGLPKSKGPGTGSQPPQDSRTAANQANRKALQKAQKGGPKQNPGLVSQ